MKNLCILATAACAAITTSASFAQCTSGPPGTTIGGIADDALISVTLPFPVLFCDGTSTTQIDVDTNGRIFPSGSGDVNDVSETVGELMGDPHPTIAALWTDLNPLTFGDILVSDNGVDTVFLDYDEVEYFGGGVAFDMRVELRTDGAWAVQYDLRLPPTLNGAIVGCSPGNGHLDPGPMDLSTGPTSGSDPALYEVFPALAMDLAGKRIDFIPNGTVDGTNGFFALVQTCQFAGSTVTGQACVFGNPVAFDWIPNGAGYIVVESTTAFDDVNLGGSIGAGDDSSTTVVLGFPFTLPGGLVVTDVDINSNGRVVQVASDAADFTPTANELLFAGGGGIAPFWTDFNVVAGPIGGGDIKFFTDSVGYATVTWDDAHQYGNPNRGMTVQLQLNAPDMWTVVYQDVNGFDPALGFAGPQALLIGASDGAGGILPAEMDFSSVLGGGSLTSTVPTLYEFFNPATDPLDLRRPELSYQADNPPQIGTVFRTTLDEIPATAILGAILLGGTNINAPLSAVWPTNPCFLYSPGDLLVADIQLLGWTPGMAAVTWGIDLTGAGPGLAGLPVVMQGVVGDLTLPWASGVAVATSRAVEATFGF